ncbi:MAG TPA: CsbD family protein [Fimbriimonas sp.]
MNWDVVKGNWKQFKGKAREQWGKITDDEWDEMQGEREQIAGRLQERYGWTKEQAHRELDTWAERHHRDPL